MREMQRFDFLTVDSTQYQVIDPDEGKVYDLATHQNLDLGVPLRDAELVKVKCLSAWWLLRCSMVWSSYGPGDSGCRTIVAVDQQSAVSKADACDPGQPCTVVAVLQHGKWVRVCASCGHTVPQVNPNYPMQPLTCPDCYNEALGGTFAE